MMMCQSIHFIFSLNKNINSTSNRLIFDLVLFWADIVWQFCLGVTGRLDNGDGHDHDDPSKYQSNADVSKDRLAVVIL